MVPEVVTLAPGFVASRIAKGNWQLAERHGAPYERQRAIRAEGGTLENIVDAAITELAEDRFVTLGEVAYAGT